jgi:hypothetical protein
MSQPSASVGPGHASPPTFRVSQGTRVTRLATVLGVGLLLGLGRLGEDRELVALYACHTVSARKLMKRKRRDPEQDRSKPLPEGSVRIGQPGHAGRRGPAGPAFDAP